MEKHYYAITRATNSLQHGNGRRRERENHKYLKREWKNGKWQYYYKEDNPYNKSSINDSARSANSKTAFDRSSLTSPVNKREQAFNDVINSVTKDINKVIDDGKRYCGKLMESLESMSKARAREQVDGIKNTVSGLKDDIVGKIDSSKKSLQKQLDSKMKDAETLEKMNNHREKLNQARAREQVDGIKKEIADSVAGYKDHLQYEKNTRDSVERAKNDKARAKLDGIGKILVDAVKDYKDDAQFKNDLRKSIENGYKNRSGDRMNPLEGIGKILVDAAKDYKNDAQLKNDLRKSIKRANNDYDSERIDAMAEAVIESMKRKFR